MEHLRTTLSIPPQWLRSYNNFITTNQASVTQVESALRSLTYILPIHTLSASNLPLHPTSTTPIPTSSDILSESLHTSIQLLSLYHDTLLFRTLPKLPGTPSQPIDPHTRYTHFWAQKSSAYRRIARFLAFIRYTELLWEMAAKRKGEKVRWHVVVFLESVKAICKMLLVQVTDTRALVTPLLPPRPEVGGEIGSEEVGQLPSLDPARRLDGEMQDAYKMPRTGLSLPPLPLSGDISTYLQSKVLTAEDIRPASSLLPSLNSSLPIHLSEYVHILTPLLYAIAMSRRRSDKYNWSPWLLGLSMELLARQLRKERGRDMYSSGSNPLGSTRLEREVWGKRGWAMGWWMMRGAFYENITKGSIYAIRERLPGIVRGVLDDYLWLWDGYYFSTCPE